MDSGSAVTAPEPREDVAVAEVLAEFLHERFAPDHEDHWRDLDGDQQRETPAWDMATALASLIAERARAAAVEALREAADEIERELICCDVYERRDHAAKHHICYWGGAARALVLDRADRRAER